MTVLGFGVFASFPSVFAFKGVANVPRRLPPGKDLDGWMTLFRSGMWRLYFTLSAEGRKRYFEEVLPLLHDTKREVLGDRDSQAWYLVFLGTKPNSQGRGYAKQLVEDGMRRVSTFCANDGEKGVRRLMLE